MRRCTPYAVLLLALVGAGGCSREQAYSWERYTSAEGRFRVLLPGTPVVKTLKEEGAAGSFNQHAVVVPLKQGDFQAAYTDLPSRPLLDFSTVIQIQATNVQHGKVVEEREFTVAGHKGRSYEIEIDKPHQFLIGRLLLVDGRLYHLMVTGPALRASSPEVKKFFESFQLMQ
jgi:hypothetical protein